MPVGTGEENLEEFGAGGVLGDTFARTFVDVHEMAWDGVERDESGRAKDAKGKKRNRSGSGMHDYARRAGCANMRRACVAKRDLSGAWGSGVRVRALHGRCVELYRRQTQRGGGAGTPRSCFKVTCPKADRAASGNLSARFRGPRAERCGSGVADKSPRHGLTLVRRHPVALGDGRGCRGISHDLPHSAFGANFAGAGRRTDLTLGLHDADSLAVQD